VAFVCVTDAEGRPLHVGAFDAKVWSAFTDSQESFLTNRTIDLDKPVNVGLQQDLVIRTIPIRESAAITEEHAKHMSSEAAAPVGYLVLALRESGMNVALQGFQAAQLMTVLGVCALCLPLVAVLLRSWIKPLRDLLEATRRLAQGQPPRPVAVSTNDELGFLATTFNDMASKLLASKQQLVEANENLERKVRARTLQLQEAVEKLDHMASTDELTTLANRRAFADQMQQCFSEANANNTDMAIVMIDLDGFKAINDTFGHERGDQLLVMMATCMKEHARRYDFPARLGGDEFIIIMPKTDLAAAKEVADNIREQFETRCRQMFRKLDPPRGVTMSMGLSCLSQTRPETSDRLVAQADTALYAAKDAGKSCLVIYEPPEPEPQEVEFEEIEGSKAANEAA